MGEENPVCLWEAEGSNREIFAGNLYLRSGKKINKIKIRVTEVIYKEKEVIN